MKNILAVIPARGESKRIKGKNVTKFRGGSAISSTKKKLKKGKILNKIIVSTDSSKIMMILEVGINHFGKIKEANKYLNYFLKSKFNYLTFMLQSEKFYKKYRRKIDFNQ